MSLVSIIIPTKNRPNFVAEAVQSVFDGDYQNFELFVVDQTPDESTSEALASFKQDPRFHYYQNRRPGYGAASSRNIGIALSNGKIIAIIDDDVVVNHDWLSNIVKEFSNDQDLQFICGKLTAPPYDSEKGLVPSFDANPAVSAWDMPILAAGANFSMRRELFTKIGGYDEFCGPGSRLGASDDGDLSFRIMRSGAKWKACPQIEVLHKNGFRNNIEGKALIKRYNRGNGGNYGRFTRRGDILAGLWFAWWQMSDFAKVIGGAILKRRRPSGLGRILNRAIGFWRGFKLSPKEGFVSGADLDRLRKQLIV